MIFKGLILLGEKKDKNIIGNGSIRKNWKYNLVNKI